MLTQKPLSTAMEKQTEVSSRPKTQQSCSNPGMLRCSATTGLSCWGQNADWENLGLWNLRCGFAWRAWLFRLLGILRVYRSNPHFPSKRLHFPMLKRSRSWKTTGATPRSWHITKIEFNITYLERAMSEQGGKKLSTKEASWFSKVCKN